MTHFLLVLAVQHPKHAFISGAKDGLLFIPRWLWNGAPGHDTRLYYKSATLFYYLNLVVFALLEVAALSYLLGLRRRRTIVRAV
jgi:hypothetical protein